VKNLIVNADDLGWTEGINRGIAEGHRKGLVTSTSLLANGRAFDSAVRLASNNPELGVGVHLNLSDGLPIAPTNEISSLLGARGELHEGPEALLLRIAGRGVKLDEIECEWDAQIKKIVRAGIEPTHLDGHKHVHMLPGLYDVALRLAKKYAIRAIRISHEESTLRSALSAGKKQKTGVVLKHARDMAERAGISTADYFCGIAQTGELTREGVEHFLEVLPEGTTELMCHPGYSDDELSQTATRLQASRQTELDILTDAGIRKIVATRGIRLINYKLVAEVA
jgi:chitin disaccharide deacetylase